MLKKDQILMSVLALLLVAGGYLGFGRFQNQTNSVEASVNSISQEDETTLGDATLVNANSVNEVSEEDLNQNEEETDEDPYFINSRLEREKMYSQMIDSYQKIIDNSELSSEQKADAQNEIIKINNEKNALMIIEKLVVTKGFKDVVVLVNKSSINVIVKAESLKPEEIAQIQNIVSRELNVEAGNIHIITKE